MHLWCAFEHTHASHLSLDVNVYMFSYFSYLTDKYHTTNNNADRNIEITFIFIRRRECVFSRVQG
jgi:hypothetical protein